MKWVNPVWKQTEAIKMYSFKTNEKGGWGGNHNNFAASVLTGSSRRNNEHQGSPQRGRSAKDQQRSKKRGWEAQAKVAVGTFICAALCLAPPQRRFCTPECSPFPMTGGITKENSTNKDKEQPTLLVNPHIFDTAPKWRQTATACSRAPAKLFETPKQDAENSSSRRFKEVLIVIL